MNKAIFFDRDGVINRVTIKNKKPFSPQVYEDFIPYAYVASTLTSLRKRGYVNIIITNQPDIRRGLMLREELERIHEYIQNTFDIDDIFVCMHDDDDHCECRKPKPGLIYRAIDKWKIDIFQSYFIGDTWKDMGTAEAVQCKSILIDKIYNKKVVSNYRVKNIKDIISIVRDGEK